MDCTLCVSSFMPAFPSTYGGVKSEIICPPRKKGILTACEVLRPHRERERESSSPNRAIGWLTVTESRERDRAYVSDPALRSRVAGEPVTGRTCRFRSVDDMQRGRSHGRRISVVSCRAVRGCRTRPRAGLLSSDKRLTLRALPVDPSAIHIVVTVAGSSETPTARALADTSVVAFAFALSASSAARRLCLCLPAL